MTYNTALSRSETWSLLTFSAACLAVLVQTLRADENGAPLIASLAVSGLAFCACYAMIRWLGGAFMRAGLKGRDLSKRGTPEIPESMGAVCAIVYLFIITTFIPFPFYKDIVAATSGGGNRDLAVIVDAAQVETGRLLDRFPHSKLASYLSAVLSLQAITLLGIGDDLFDIRWRHKLFIPAFASIPMLIVYFVDFGVTSVVIPTPLQPYLAGRDLLDLGWAYYAYMAAVCIFSPNSINILAGINGIEVAQSIVVALLIILNDLLYILPSYGIQLPFSLPRPPDPAYKHPATDSHLFSLYLLLPFLGVSTALLAHNWFPARVFVGDTYCYFAGMVFAVVAILAHFSKTLLLLLLPQIFNFLYSAPQLFGLVPCPRHRLPKFNARTGLLENSWADFAPARHLVPSSSSSSTITNEVDSTSLSFSNGSNGTSHKHTRSTSSSISSSPPPTQESTLHPLTQSALKLLSSLHLIKIETDHSSGAVLRCTNLTLLNLWLVWFGPMREDRLALGLLAFQTLVGIVGLVVRHRLALFIFRADNLV